jgi:hypothetical protein
MKPILAFMTVCALACPLVASAEAYRGRIISVEQAGVEFKIDITAADKTVSEHAECILIARWKA